MGSLSENAEVLLSTIKSQGTKYPNMGTYFTDGLVAYWYHSKNRASALEETDRAAIRELLDKGLAHPWRRKRDEYELTPRGEAYTLQTQAQSTVYNQNFSNIHGSNISNMSSDVLQTLNIESYSPEVQQQFSELQEAIKSDDDTRAKRIIDGLWVSAPQLVLSLLQVALAIPGGKS